MHDIRRPTFIYLSLMGNLGNFYGFGEGGHGLER